MITFVEAWNSYAAEVSADARIHQRQEELSAAWNEVHSLNCSSLLEIGTRNGGSLYVLAHALLPGAKVVALDLAERVSDQKNTEAALASLRDKGFNTRYIIGDSKDPNTIDQAMAEWPIHAVHIDGDHTTRGIENDWQQYGRHATRCCLIHDIRKNAVLRFWDDLKARNTDYYYLEFAEQANMGIGVVIFP